MDIKKHNRVHWYLAWLHISICILHLSHFTQPQNFLRNLGIFHSQLAYHTPPDSPAYPCHTSPTPTSTLTPALGQIGNAAVYLWIFLLVPASLPEPVHTCTCYLCLNLLSAPARQFNCIIYGMGHFIKPALAVSLRLPRCLVNKPRQYRFMDYSMCCWCEIVEFSWEYIYSAVWVWRRIKCTIKWWNMFR